MAANPELDGWFDSARQWRDEMLALRALVLDFPLQETRKWYQPVYAFDGANVAIISAFKDYCCLSFFKGALLDDPQGLLSRPGENTQGGRLVKLTSLAEVARLTPALRGFVQQAIANEEAGRKVDYSVNRTLDLADELVQAFADIPGLEAAFRALTPGRQRAYNLHFTGAKQSATRRARIEKCAPDILAGRGFNDR